MADEPVLCAIDRRGVASVTLDRPQVNDAYDGALILTFARLAGEPGVRCLVVWRAVK
ncbi:MAG: hypothetical protein WA459_00945 [Stellaceae bacterium]